MHKDLLGIKIFDSRIGPDVFFRKKHRGRIPWIFEIIGKEKNAFIFALGEEGRECGSVEFARKIASLPQKVIFIIGGHAGLDPSVKRHAHEILALSRMTFTHEIARMLLMGANVPLGVNNQ